MDMLIDTQTGDYAGTRTTTLANAVWLRLMTPLGSWWADPTLGSLLYTLEREKDRPRVAVLAVQYVEQALEPLTDDGRAQTVTVTAEQNGDGWLRLVINVVTASGQAQTFTHHVRVL
ncbi:hypothetical protein EHW64_13560 [Erwinia psidii]|uniref:phage GP46 family protein n=1 Tax=Erwinia psidii TaxID=69224 RepID=UPI00226B08D8|nr:phage GP46 family protein [Erwinia psidii]MCX8962129.1 hypothetical protein [Erwinia psidii]